MDEPALPREAPAAGAAVPEDDALLAELVTRLLDRGVVVSGEVVISLAGVDLVYLGLRLLLASAESLKDGIEAVEEDAGREEDARSEAVGESG